MTIHASVSKFPGALCACASFACRPPSPPLNHGPVAGSYWNSISDPDLTPVSCVVSCLGSVALPPKILVVRDPPRPVSQSNIATRLCPPRRPLLGAKVSVACVPG